MRYGQVDDFKQKPEELRVNILMQDMGRIDFGNSGVPNVLQELLKEKRELVEDAFFGSDSLYILPATREFAKELFYTMVGEKDGEYDYFSFADDIRWVKLGDRYWLSLWWD